MIPVQIESRPGARPGGMTDAAFSPVVAPIGEVRLRPAMLRDMDAVEPLIRGFAREGLLLPKSLEQLYRTFREFVVAVDEEDRLVACVALRVHTPKLAEVSALAVAESAHGRGIGRRLLEHLLEDARALGLETLFAMTLEPGFFGRLAFRRVERSLFPNKIAADCVSCPRRDNCREITMARPVTGDAEPIVEASDG